VVAEQQHLEEVVPGVDPLTTATNVLSVEGGYGNGVLVVPYGMKVRNDVRMAALAADTGARLWDVQITGSPFSDGLEVTTDKVFHAIGSVMEVRALKTGGLLYMIGKPYTPPDPAAGPHGTLAAQGLAPGKQVGMRGSKRSRLVALMIVGLAAPKAAAQEVRTTTQPLLGPVNQADDCTPELQQFNEEIMVFGRITATTRAFEQCVDQDVRARYRKCVGDPYYSESFSSQITRVIAASRLPGPVQITCTGGGGNASTQLGNYGNPSEAFSWGGWFESVFKQIGRPACTGNQTPDTHSCSWDSSPWPHSQAAGIVWHEVMHTQGYSHGANTQAEAKPACGYAGDPTWNFQSNTMPYILGECINKVIYRSGRRCAVQACPSPHQRRMLTSYDGTACTCVNDPGKKGLAILGLVNASLVDYAMLPDEDWIGDWHYGKRNLIRATGDFDGDGVADFVLTSSWGLGVVTHVDGQWRALAVKPSGTRLGSWNLNADNDRVLGVGDFDGDGKDELVLASGWGIGILRHTGSTFTHLMMAPSGARFGGWNFNATGDTIRAIDDFNGDGKADLVITSAWGIGVLTRSGATLTPLMAAPGGTQFGGWNFNATGDLIRGAGDFDGDGKADLLITSPWGIGLLRLQAGSLVPLMMTPSGGKLGGYDYNNTTDRLGGFGDFNGDGKADLVLATPQGLLLLGWDAATTRLQAIAIARNDQPIGGWHLNTRTDMFIPAGDLDGDGRDELVVRSNWGLGVLRRTATGGLSLVDARAKTGLFGSWQLAANDKLLGVDRFIRPGHAPAAVHGGLLMQR